MRRLDRPEIVTRVQHALGTSQRELGERLGASRRTVNRWACGKASPAEAHIERLARLVHPVDPQLAERIAEHLGGTLESLKIVAPRPGTPPSPPPFVPSHAQLVDGVVCAAAEAMDVSPRAVRPALLAAVVRARDLRLTLDELVTALSPAGK